jgi:hypothetical protein
VNDFAEAVARLERELPGWWWQVGVCSVSADASIAPEGHSPDADLIEHGNEFDSGFHADLAPPATIAQALNSVIDQALAARMARRSELAGG